MFNLKGREKIEFLILLFLFFIALNIHFPCVDLFDYNLMEILTAVTVTLAIYFLTKQDNDLRNKNKKIEEIVDLLKNKVNSVFGDPIKGERKEEYLHTFKYIDNKIYILKKLSSHLNCNDKIESIEQEKTRLDEFINENIGQGELYFLREEVKEKIPNILCNIETHLDAIVLKIYVNEK